MSEGQFWVDATLAVAAIAACIAVWSMLLA